MIGNIEESFSFRLAYGTSLDVTMTEEVIKFSYCGIWIMDLDHDQFEAVAHRWSEFQRRLGDDLRENAA